jgi:(p)ppGpp synthase/HD superfamily hydrolase
MATLERAVEIAAKAHAGVKDKQGQPYILHPIRVMMGVEDDDAKMVAVLHDVIEDTEVTLDDIRAAGFSEAVIAALDLVTHRKDRPLLGICDRM